MAWVKIDDQFYDHPRWADAPGDSIALWLASMAWCNRNDSTTGLIPRTKTHGLVNVRNLKTTLADLVARGALHESPAGYVIHDYAEYQQPEKVRQIAEKRAANGRKGAAKRWEEYHRHRATPQANGIPTAMAQPIANAIAKQCPGPVSRDPSTSSVTEWSSSTTTTGHDDDDQFHQVIAHIVDAKALIWPPRRMNSWRPVTTRNTITEDGNLVRALIAEHTPLEHIVLHVLGHGTSTEKARAEAPEHDPNCTSCDGGFIAEIDANGVTRYAVCPNTKTSP